MSKCILFTGFKDKQGYGVKHYNGKNYMAHRLAYIQNIGPIPKNMYVLHTCDNPSCINPEHLRLGNHQDNMDDRRLKRRNGRKLTWEDVQEIRKSDKTGPELAPIYGVTKQTIWDIRRKEYWK